MVVSRDRVSPNKVMHGRRPTCMGCIIWVHEFVTWVE